MDKKTADSSHPGTQIRAMKETDLPEVQRIECLSFPSPWPCRLFEIEMQKIGFSYYLVIEHEDGLVGYAGYWRIGIEGHIVTVAIDPVHRKRGLARKLLSSLIDHCKSLNLQRITLEVRQNNCIAQRLYEQLGFHKVAIQQCYYEDTKEDALVYWKLL